MRMGTLTRKAYGTFNINHLIQEKNFPRSSRSGPMATDPFWKASQKGVI